MADVEKVEDTVAENDFLPLGAESIQPFREVFERKCFADRRHACASMQWGNDRVLRFREFGVDTV
jgi:hypothetical protein